MNINGEIPKPDEVPEKPNECPSVPDPLEPECPGSPEPEPAERYEPDLE